MAAHNSATGSTETIVEPVKVGNTVKILSIDSVTAQLYPELIGMEVAITDIDIDGDLVFAYDKPVPKGTSFERRNKTHLIMIAQDNWRWEVVK